MRGTPPHLSPKGRGRSRSAAQASGEGCLRARGLAERPLTRRASNDARRPLPCGERWLSAVATRLSIDAFDAGDHGLGAQLGDDGAEMLQVVDLEVDGELGEIRRAPGHIDVVDV